MKTGQFFDDDNFYAQRMTVSAEVAAVMNSDALVAEKVTAATSLLCGYFYDRSLRSSGGLPHPDFETYVGDFLRANQHHAQITGRLGGAEVMSELINIFPARGRARLDAGNTYWYA